jgi:hypothetical protein
VLKCISVLKQKNRIYRHLWFVFVFVLILSEVYNHPGNGLQRVSQSFFRICFCQWLATQQQSN